MVSTGLLLKRLIEPVVILSVPHPAVPAASAATKATVRNRLPVLLIVRLIDIGAQPSL
jgi:hypothetical protein